MYVWRGSACNIDIHRHYTHTTGEDRSQAQEHARLCGGKDGLQCCVRITNITQEQHAAKVQAEKEQLEKDEAKQLQQQPEKLKLQLPTSASTLPKYVR